MAKLTQVEKVERADDAMLEAVEMPEGKGDHVVFSKSLSGEFRPDCIVFLA